MPVLVDSKGLLQIEAVDVAWDSLQHPLISPSEETTTYRVITETDYTHQNFIATYWGIIQNELQRNDSKWASVCDLWQLRLHQCLKRVPQLILGTCWGVRYVRLSLSAHTARASFIVNNPFKSFKATLELLHRSNFTLGALLGWNLAQLSLLS